MDLEIESRRTTSSTTWSKKLSSGLWGHRVEVSQFTDSGAGLAFPECDIRASFNSKTELLEAIEWLTSFAETLTL